MAVTAAGALSNFSGFLTPDEAGPIFQRAVQASTVQRLVQQVPLSINGQSIPIFGEINATWVGEGAKKDSQNLPFNMKSMTPQKIAVIVPVSREVVRRNPGGFMQQVRLQMGAAFGRAFDKAVLYDQGGDGTAGAGPFSTWIAQTTKSVEMGTATTANGGIRSDLIAGMSLLVQAGKDLTGYALDARFEPALLDAKDTTGRPIFNLDEQRLSPEEQKGAVRRATLLARDAYIGRGVYSGTAADIVGIGGDWDQCAWGQIGGIEYDVSTQATVTINGALVSLWENNLVAVRAETEFGWICNDVESFVKYVDTVTPWPVTGS